MTMRFPRHIHGEDFRKLCELADLFMVDVELHAGPGFDRDGSQPLTILLRGRHGEMLDASPVNGSLDLTARCLATDFANLVMQELGDE